MGLSASQARLLSLTNRQHTIENQAQAYQERKVLLANNSDAVYKKYVHALDNNMLKTIQTNTDNGDATWINGTLNNLMRNGTANNTSGNVFYIQDLATGKLYMPENMSYETITSKDDHTVKTGDIKLSTALSNVTGTTLEEQARSFAEQFGVTYTKTDVNEDKVINYQNAVNLGWDKALGGATDADNDAVYEAYYEAKAKDTDRSELANSALACLPTKNANGMYMSYTANGDLYKTYRRFAKDIVNKFGTVDATTKKVTANSGSPYTSQELNIIRASLNVYDSLIKSVQSKFPEKAYTEETTSGPFSSTKDYISKLYDLKAEYSVSSTEKANYAEVGFTDDTAWADKTYGEGAQFSIMLNGGEVTATGKKGEINVTNVFNRGRIEKKTDITYVDQVEKFNVYDETDVTGQIFSSMLGSYKSFGAALSDIFERVGSETLYADTVLKDNGITGEDIDNYRLYKQYKADYKDYMASEKVYEYTPSDKSKADQYEQIYMALVSCGKSNTTAGAVSGKREDERFKIYASNGYIACNDDRAKNLTWVSNMIQNAQVIINSWDSENSMLSKTSPSLNTKLRQVKDNSKIEEASQQYEEELAEIKQKDNAYDTKLEQLETERNAIDTEVQSLKDIINANIEKHFKAFG